MVVCGGTRCMPVAVVVLVVSVNTWNSESSGGTGSGRVSNSWSRWQCLLQLQGSRRNWSKLHYLVNGFTTIYCGRLVGPQLSRDAGSGAGGGGGGSATGAMVVLVGGGSSINRQLCRNCKIMVMMEGGGQYGGGGGGGGGAAGANAILFKWW